MLKKCNSTLSVSPHWDKDMWNVFPRWSWNVSRWQYDAIFFQILWPFLSHFCFIIFNMTPIYVLQNEGTGREALCLRCCQERRKPYLERSTISCLSPLYILHSFHVNRKELSPNLPQHRYSQKSASFCFLGLSWMKDWWWSFFNVPALGFPPTLSIAWPLHNAYWILLLIFTWPCKMARHLFFKVVKSSCR